MFHPSQYRLMDFGDGRKLERFASFVLDRPAPAAAGCPRRGEVDWQRVDGYYQRDTVQRGEWKCNGALPSCWNVQHASYRFQLRCTPFGHLGVFPEQAENWDWIDGQVRSAARSLRVLNLFAYTGGSTMAAAAAGAHVVHLDAAKNVAAWARQNAELSQLSAAPIRWITEDARRFVERELRRGNRYDAVVLDPPSYGHGPRREPWKIDRHLGPLLRACRDLTADRLAFFLLSCHSPGFDAARLRELVATQVFSRGLRGLQVKPLQLADGAGRKLPCGLVARWPQDAR